MIKQAINAYPFLCTVYLARGLPASNLSIALYFCNIEMSMLTLARSEMPKSYRKRQDESETNLMVILMVSWWLNVWCIRCAKSPGHSVSKNQWHEVTSNDCDDNTYTKSKMCQTLIGITNSLKNYISCLKRLVINWKRHRHLSSLPCIVYSIIAFVTSWWYW